MFSILIKDTLVIIFILCSYKEEVNKKLQEFEAAMEQKRLKVRTLNNKSLDHFTI